VVVARQGSLGDDRFEEGKVARIGEEVWLEGDRPKNWSQLNRVPMSGHVAREDAFHTILALEHRRAERSRSRFALMLLDSRSANGTGSALHTQIVSILLEKIRETDLIGWYEQGVLGVLFTELAPAGAHSVIEILHARVVKALRDRLHRSLASTLIVTLRVFPKGSEDSVVDVALYPETPGRPAPKAYPDVQTEPDAA